MIIADEMSETFFFLILTAGFMFVMALLFMSSRRYTEKGNVEIPMAAFLFWLATLALVLYTTAFCGRINDFLSWPQVMRGLNSLADIILLGQTVRAQNSHSRRAESITPD